MTLVTHDLVTIIRRLDPSLVARIKSPNGLLVGGGFIRDCITGDQPHDIDVFASSKDKAAEQAASLAAEKQCKKIETPNAFTVCCRPLSVQFIHKWTFTSALECIQSFDFTIAQAAIWWDRGWLSVCADNFYSDLAAKRLVYTRPVRDEAPGGSLLRVLKLYQRGYRIPLSSMAAVVSQLIGKIDAGKKERFMADSQWREQLLTGLLYDVDPSTDPRHYMEEEPNAQEVTQQVVA